VDRYVATDDLYVGWAKAHTPGLLPETVDAATIERNGWGDRVEVLKVAEKDTPEQVAEKVAAKVEPKG
jgi:hypothetical protein